MRAILIVPFAAILIAVQAHAQTPAPVTKEPVEVQATGTLGKAETKQTLHLTAPVTAVDPVGRTITLKVKSGEELTFWVRQDVKRLDEVVVGDVVVVDYERGFALEFQPVDERTVPPTTTSSQTLAGKGLAPEGAQRKEVKGTVVVTAIDPAKRLITFQGAGPEGKVYQVAAGPKVKIEILRVGDRLLATYSESVAVKLEKAKKK